jgi:hypothetical protein
MTIAQSAWGCTQRGENWFDVLAQNLHRAGEALVIFTRRQISRLDVELALDRANNSSRSHARACSISSALRRRCSASGREMRATIWPSVTLSPTAISTRSTRPAAAETTSTTRGRRR